MNSLQPNNQEERRKFWDFRSEDILEMFDIRVLVYITFAATNLFIFLYDTDKFEQRNILIFNALRLIPVTLVWVSIKRCKKYFSKYFIYSLPALLLCSRILMICGVVAAVNAVGEADIEKAVIIIDNGKFNSVSDIAVYVLLLSPSLRFMLIYYVPIFIGEYAYLTVRYNHLSDS